MTTSAEARPGSQRMSIRLFLIIEAIAFAAAALVHFGVLVRGYEHRTAGTAESIIAAVLIAGLATSAFLPARTRISGLAAQGFALLGTLIGLFTIAIGIGPTTVPDVVYHVAIVIVLLWGLAVAWRSSFGTRQQG